MPDYFLALNKQYGLAINDQQAETHVKAVIQAWYLTLAPSKQKVLLKTLPEYLRPHPQLFFHRRKFKLNTDQYGVVCERLLKQLQKTDQKEVEKIIKGVFKSLKVVVASEQKFELSQLMDGKLLPLFVEA